MSTPAAALRCQGFVKRFADTIAVGRLDLTVPTGTIFGLLGPNGSGKTSTMRTALGIYVPDGGSVELLGSSDPMAVRHRIGYLPKERGLYAKMKVVEQLAFLASILGLDQKEATRRAGAWLERVGLAANAQSPTGELSKGMQQKVQFASAVIHDPDLVVLDEPFTGLDPVNSRLLKELILEQRERGATVVLSTHRMEQVEALCESICLIDHGRLVLSGVLADIKAGYGRNTIDLEYRGTPGALRGVPGVRRCEDTGQEAQLELEPDADAQAVIRSLLDRVEVQPVRLDHPHIEEIYLEKVGHRAVAPETMRTHESRAGRQDRAPRISRPRAQPRVHHHDDHGPRLHGGLYVRRPPYFLDDRHRRASPRHSRHRDRSGGCARGPARRDRASADRGDRTDRGTRRLAHDPGPVQRRCAWGDDRRLSRARRRREHRGTRPLLRTGNRKSGDARSAGARGRVNHPGPLAS